MPCLVGCAAEYSCRQNDFTEFGIDNKLIRPLDSEVLAPYCRVFFEDIQNPDESAGISVGNESAPQFGNTAIIKSAQIGGSTGMGATIEILDEMGGAFHLFVEKINKCIKNTKAEYIMGVEFGWVTASCFTYMSRIVKSQPVYYNLINLEITYQEGKIKFILSGSDQLQSVFSARHDKIYGTDDTKMPLKTAIRQLVQDDPPQFNVEFVRVEKDGTRTEYKFNVEGPSKQGPEEVWKADGQNKLATIQKWLESYRTDRDKGIIALWDGSKSDGGTLVLMEDVQPTLDETVNDCDLTTNVGTYIVNGGECSPVISFTPKINYIANFSSFGSGGNAGGALTGKTVEKTQSGLQTPETGILQSIPPSKNSRSVYGKEAAVETEKSQNAHLRASLLTKAAGGITAELRVQGDPRPEYLNPKTMQGKTLSLVVVNPYHLFGEEGCGDWLAIPGCNEVLSNKRWEIKGVEHSIKEGSFTTTLNISLIAPGISHGAGGSFGGTSNGYVPKNTC